MTRLLFWACVAVSAVFVLVGVYFVQPHVIITGGISVVAWLRATAANDALRELRESRCPNR